MSSRGSSTAGGLHAHCTSGVSIMRRQTSKRASWMSLFGCFVACVGTASQVELFELPAAEGLPPARVGVAGPNPPSLPLPSASGVKPDSRMPVPQDPVVQSSRDDPRPPVDGAAAKPVKASQSTRSSIPRLHVSRGVVCPQRLGPVRHDRECLGVVRGPLRTRLLQEFALGRPAGALPCLGSRLPGQPLVHQSEALPSGRPWRIRTGFPVQFSGLSLSRRQGRMIKAPHGKSERGT
jgi:hypothetical protein